MKSTKALFKQFEHCPRCRSGSILLIGTAEADEAILGVDEYIYTCYDCHTEWVREKGGTRLELLA